MIPDSVYGGRSPTSNGAAHSVLSSATPAVVAPERVDLLRVLTGLRHLAGSTEPGRVFAELAAVCVPALCDDVIVDIEEDGGHRYRIRRPGSSPATGVIAGAAARPAEAATEDLSAEPEGREVRLTARSVSVRVCSLPGGGPQYTTRLVCSWRTGYTPTEAVRRWSGCWPITRPRWCTGNAPPVGWPTPVSLTRWGPPRWVTPSESPQRPAS